MKNKILLLAGVATSIWCTQLNAQLCTEDFLYNTKFEHVDNLGLPLDWRTRGDYENRGVEVEDGVLKAWVGEGGNHEKKGKLFLAQKFYDAINVISTLGSDTMYLRAWVKSTAIDEPTDEELLAAYLKDDPDRDTTGTNFRHNFQSFGGFGLIVQEANTIPAPPFFDPVEWTPLYDHDGELTDGWEAVNGKMVLGKNGSANYLDFWVQLRSKSACTVWVDNIQISSSPDFCGESFESPGPVGTNPGKTVNKRNNVLYLHNTMIKFGSPTQYTLNIFDGTGRLCRTIAEKGSEIQLQDIQLPAGAYILDLKSERGNLVQSFIRM